MCRESRNLVPAFSLIREPMVGLEKWRDRQHRAIACRANCLVAANCSETVITTPAEVR